MSKWGFILLAVSLITGYMIYLDAKNGNALPPQLVFVSIISFILSLVIFKVKYKK